MRTRRIDGPIGIAVKAVANLQNPVKAFQRLRVARMFAQLRFEKGLADLFEPPQEKPAGLFT